MAEGKIRREDILSDDAIKALELLNQAITSNVNSMKKLIDEEKKLKTQSDQNKQNQKELMDLMSREAKTISEARRQNIELRKARNDVNTTTKKGKKELSDLNKQIDRNNKLIKNNSDALTKQKIGIGKYSQALQGAVVKMAAWAAAIKGAIRFIGNIIKTSDNFEAQMDRVAAVTRASSSEFTKLKNNAKLLGATTSKSATEVGKLSEEFAKLGFTTKDILNATEATIRLAEATGSELSQSAIVAASTIRGFGLDASETQRIVDVMALSFASSALDINKFQTIMAQVAPVAKTVGLEVEGATAMVSALVDAGLDASTAGSSLRNILLENAKNGRSMRESLDLLNNSSNKAATAFDLFGKRGVAAAIVLSDNIDKTAQLTESYKRASGSAEAMAKVIQDNLTGDVTKLKSAWEGLILSIDDGGGVLSKTIRGLVQFTTALINNLSGIDSIENDLIDTSAQFSKEIDEESNKMNILFEQLKKVNPESETAFNLRQKINQLYGSYLPNLLTEKTTLDEIGSSQKIVNDRLLQSIAIRYQQEAISKINAAQIQRETELFETYANTYGVELVSLQSAFNEFYNERNQNIIEGGKLFKIDNQELTRELGLQENQFNSLIGVFKQISKFRDSDADSIENIIDKYKVWIKNIDDVKTSQILEGDTEEELEKARLERIRRRISDNKLILKTQRDDATFKKEQSEEEEEYLYESTENELASLDEIIEKDNQKIETQIANDNKLTQEKSKNIQLRRAIDSAYFNESINLVNELFDLKASLNNKEEEMVSRRYDKLLKEAEGNATATEYFERIKARKIAEIQRKQAKLDRTAALFNIAINTASAIAKIWAEVPKFDLGISTGILTGLAIAQGVAQTAAVLAQPLPEIPAFAEGGKTKGGPIIAGEKGAELGILPSGHAFLTEDKPTLYPDLPKGTEIIPNDMIKNDLANIKKDYQLYGGVSLDYRKIEKSNEKNADRIINAISSRPINEFNITEKGFFVQQKKGRDKTIYIDLLRK